MATAFPSGGRSIIERMYGRYPELVVNDDDKRRELVRYIGEQFAYAYGPQWGNKKRSGLSDAFRSADSIAVLEPDATISVWDYQQGNAELTIIVNDGDQPTHPNLSPNEADFMPCQKVNHLDGDAEPPEPEEPANDLEPRVADLETQVEMLEAQIAAQDVEMDLLQTRLMALEQHTLKDSDVLKVIGRTESSVYHQHAVNLIVRREP